MKTISNGFKVTGVYPFNRNCLKESGKYKAFNPQSLTEKSGLAYIPLYSPARVPKSKPAAAIQHHVPSDSTPRVRRSFSFPSLDSVGENYNYSQTSVYESPGFSVEELFLFTRRFENGYEDKRYNLCLRTIYSRDQSKLLRLTIPNNVL